MQATQEGPESAQGIVVLSLVMILSTMTMMRFLSSRCKLVAHIDGFDIILKDLEGNVSMATT